MNAQLTDRATKRRVHGKVQNAIKRGELRRQPCAVCGAPNAHGHHADYNKPLEVMFLCQLHHDQIHHKKEA